MARKKNNTSLFGLLIELIFGVSFAAIIIGTVLSIGMVVLFLIGLGYLIYYFIKLIIDKYKQKKEQENLQIECDEVAENEIASSYQEIDNLGDYISQNTQDDDDSLSSPFIFSNNNEINEELEPSTYSSLNYYSDNQFDEDEYYEMCRSFVIYSQKASTSLLQRQFRIGYTAAAHIIDRLEHEGVIGPQIGSQPREVYEKGYSTDHQENTDAVKTTNHSNYIFTIHTPMKSIDYIYEWLRDNPNTLEEISKQLKDLITINDYQINYAIDTLLKNNAIFYHNHVLEVTDNFYFRFEYEPNEEYEVLSNVYNTPSYQEFQNIKTGIEFEYFLADLLKKSGYETELTPKSNDYGADIIATRDNIKYAIQCKFYSNPIGISAVQEVLGALQYYKCNVAIVATNNTYTNNALELAQKSNVILWDGNYILKTFI